MSDGELGEEEVSVALQRLLSWPDIARSGQLSKFLSYIVERKLSGNAHSIKAYSIAVDVFGRPANFDPQTDPIVRVQARRLRALISQFYRDEGAEDDVRIALPTGRYVPEFIRRGELAEAEPESEGADTPVETPVRGGLGGLPATWFVLALLTAGLAILAFGLSAWMAPDNTNGAGNGLIEPPSILITEFQSLTGDMADLGMAAGLAIELVGDLEQFEMIDVLYGGGAASDDEPGTDYVLGGIVRREAGGLQYSAILTDVASGSVVWNRTISLQGSELARADLLSHVAGRLSTVLGSPRGPLHQEARALLAGNPALDGDENLYLCRVLFDLYRERSSAESSMRGRNCFSRLGPAEGNSGAALAAVASLTAESAAGLGDAGNGEDQLMVANVLMARAAAAAPVSAFVWEQRARLLDRLGRHDLAEAAYSTASQINPANTDAIAARARHLAFLGRQEAAMRLMVPVMTDSPGPPPWYFVVPALEALRMQDYDQAVGHALVYAEADRELGPILAVMAGQGLGDADIVNRYLPQVLDLSSFRSMGVLTRMRQRISDERLLRDIRVALLTAGVPPAALNAPF